MVLNKIQTIQRHQFRVSDSVTLESGVTVPTITGQCGQVEVISQNGYRYRNGFWDKVLSDPCVQEGIRSREYLGCIEHPIDDAAYLKTPYTEASHVVLKAWVQDGNPYAVLGLLNNEKGNQIKALVDIGHRPGVSTRGLGCESKDQTSLYIVEDDYVFLGWDVVTSPNFPELKLDKVSDSLMSTPLFKELVQMHGLKDSAFTGYNREALLKDMNNLIKELTEKFEKLQSC